MKGDRMIANGKELVLTQGPSREELFDVLKLGSVNKELSCTEFWGESRGADGSVAGASLLVHMNGVHLAASDARQWFFWGKLRLKGSGDTWVPKWEAEDSYFVFGCWDSHSRTGKIRFSETSFFRSPLTMEIRLSPEEIMERLGRLCRLGTSVMCRPGFPAPSKWYVSMKGVQISVHTIDMSGPTPEEAIVNAWREISRKEKAPILVRYFCARSDEPIPGNGPQVWVKWDHDKDDWDDAEIPNNEWHMAFASHASEIRRYVDHRFLEAS